MGPVPNHPSRFGGNDIPPFRRPGGYGAGEEDEFVHDWSNFNEYDLIIDETTGSLYEVGNRGLINNNPPLDLYGISKLLKDAQKEMNIEWNLRESFLAETYGPPKTQIGTFLPVVWKPGEITGTQTGLLSKLLTNDIITPIKPGVAGSAAESVFVEAFRIPKSGPTEFWLFIPNPSTAKAVINPLLFLALSLLDDVAPLVGQYKASAKKKKDEDDMVEVEVDVITLFYGEYMEFGFTQSNGVFNAGHPFIRPSVDTYRGAIANLGGTVQI